MPIAPFEPAKVSGAIPQMFAPKSDNNNSIALPLDDEPPQAHGVEAATPKVE
jgi:hypothetical protein